MSLSSKDIQDLRDIFNSSDEETGDEVSTQTSPPAAVITDPCLPLTQHNNGPHHSHRNPPLSSSSTEISRVILDVGVPSHSLDQDDDFLPKCISIDPMDEAGPDDDSNTEYFESPNYHPANSINSSCPQALLSGPAESVICSPDMPSSPPALQFRGRITSQFGETSASVREQMCQLWRIISRYEQIESSLLTPLSELSSHKTQQWRKRMRIKYNYEMSLRTDVIIFCPNTDWLKLKYTDIETPDFVFFKFKSSDFSQALRLIRLFACDKSRPIFVRKPTSSYQIRCAGYQSTK